MSVARSARTAAVLLGVPLVSLTARAEPPTKQECVAANEEAQHLKRTHKWLEARKRLFACVAPSCPEPVRDDCLDMLSVIQKAMPTVVLAAQDPTGADVRSVTVAVDGVLRTREVDGSALEVDPGDHTFSFEGEGYVPSRETVHVKPWERDRPLRVVLRPVVEPPPPPPRPSPPTPATAPPEPSGAPPADRPVPVEGARHGDGSTRRAAFVALGVGAVGVAVGTVFGLAAMNRQAMIDEQCPNGACPAASQPEIGARHTDAIASAVSLGAGVLGLAVGALLLLSSDAASTAATPRTSALARPELRPGRMGLRLTFP